MPRVRLKNGPAKGQTFEISDAPLNVGRDPTCTIQVVDKGASRNHSEIFRIGEMCFIRDLESRNGTYVNESKIDEELLREGDRIQIGGTLLVFESADRPGSENDSDVEFSEEDPGNTLELRIEDLSAINVGEGDGNEARRLRAIYRCGRIIAEESEEKALIDKVLPFVAEQTRADCGYLFTRDSQTGNIVPIGTWSAKERRSGKVSRSIIRRAIQEKRALLTSDAMQDNRFSARDSIMLKEIHSVICVPLSVGGDLSGVLYLASDNPGNVFSEEELELTAAIADQIGLAISHLRIQRSQREYLMSTIRVLVRAAEMRDPSQRGRSERIAQYAVAIGRQMNMTSAQLDSLQLAALLHDIGKIAEACQTCPPDEAAETPAVPEDRRLVEQTLDVVREMALFPQIEEAIKYQLERNDGSGPAKMSGKEIPLSARVLAVASFYDSKVNANDTDQSASALLKDAVVEIGRQAGRIFDEDVVKALLIAHRNGTLYAALDESTDADVET